MAVSELVNLYHFRGVGLMSRWWWWEVSWWDSDWLWSGLRACFAWLCWLCCCFFVKITTANVLSDKNVSSCDFLQKMLIFYHVAKIPNGKSLSTKTLVWMGLVGGQQTFYFKWRDKLSDSHQNLTFGSYLCVIVFSYIHKSYFSYSHPGKLSRLKLKSELFFEKPQIQPWFHMTEI